MRTKTILLICTSVTTALIVMATLIFSLTALILAAKNGGKVNLELIIAFQEAIYIPIFSTYIGLFIYECWMYSKRRGKNEN